MSAAVVASACSRRSTSFAVSACAFVTVATIDAFCASARASMILAFSRIFASSASRTPFAARSFAFAFASLRQFLRAIPPRHQRPIVPAAPFCFLRRTRRYQPRTQ